MGGPVGSPSPGIPIVLAFLGLFAAIYFRSALYARSRRRGVIGKHDQRVDVIVTAMAVVCFLVVLWTMWTKG